MLRLVETPWFMKATWTRQPMPIRQTDEGLSRNPVVHLEDVCHEIAEGAGDAPYKILCRTVKRHRYTAQWWWGQWWGENGLPRGQGQILRYGFKEFRDEDTLDGQTREEYTPMTIKGKEMAKMFTCVWRLFKYKSNAYACGLLWNVHNGKIGWLQ